ncbi:ArsR/SmtB family transcription factor [Clostridium sp. UBA4548]|uniref:ArsR/SmtB family transcription factor n=1 Tax=Clostridium sp. UBA4548 TaxID=1946361 RepID=UPI0025BAAB6D|nr:metalloregulator ArsR/SmtB family transcription factor [Clostridium sp. UBA4548]
MENLNNDVCSCNFIHEDVVNRVKDNILDESTISSLSELFKAIADPTRIKIINILINTEACVCDIAALLNMTQSAISHQLRVLKSARLVKYRKEGKVVYYSLDDYHVNDIFDKGLNHVRE